MAFFQQNASGSSIRELCFHGHWDPLPSVMATSLMTPPVQQPDSPTPPSISIGTALLALHVPRELDGRLIEFLCSNVPRLACLTIYDCDLEHTCVHLPNLVRLRELTTTKVSMSEWNRPALVRAMRANGSLHKLSVSHPLSGTERRWIEAYCQRNRVAQRSDGASDDAVVADLVVWPLLFEAFLPAKRTAPTSLLARLLLLENDSAQLTCGEKRLGSQN